MSYSATGPEASLSGGAQRQNALSLLFFLLVSIAFLTRFCISPQMMNAVMDYTAESGAFYEKLHFGTYAILLLLPVVLFSRPIYLVGDEIGKFRALVRFCLLITGLIVFLVLTGRAGSSGFFIDSYLVAGAAGLMLYALNPEMRRAVGNVVLCMLLLSALIGLFEAVTETRIFPYNATEEQFRPIGMTDHPLTLGMMCASAIGFVALTRWRTWVKVGAILLLFIGCAASGARFALLLGGAEIIALLVLVPWTRLSPRHEAQAKFVVLLITVIGGAALVAVLFAGGLLSRFSETIFDKNYMARITIYEIFGLVDFKSILFGADLNAILKVVNEKLKLPFIESTPVYLTFQLGAPLAIAFAVLVFWIFGRMLKAAARPAWIGTAIFFLTALSNNTLSSKTPVVTVFLVLIIAFGATPKSVRAEATPPASG